MAISDPHIWRDTRSEIEPPEDVRGAAAGGQFPVSRKRVVFRYWLGAIVLGCIIWGGIAIAVGIV